MSLTLYSSNATPLTRSRLSSLQMRQEDLVGLRKDIDSELKNTAHSLIHCREDTSTAS